MGVYINMEMPTEGFVEILIRDDGTVQQTGQSYRIDGTDYYTPYIGEMPVIYEAISIPPHGDLIERDKLVFEDDYYGWRDKQVVKAAPTILEAEEGET